MSLLGPANARTALTIHKPAVRPGAINLSPEGSGLPNLSHGGSRRFRSPLGIDHVKGEHCPAGASARSSLQAAFGSAVLQLSIRLISQPQGSTRSHI